MTYVFSYHRTFFLHAFGKYKNFVYFCNKDNHLVGLKCTCFEIIEMLAIRNTSKYPEYVLVFSELIVL
jgi:hypothetical protein